MKIFFVAKAMRVVLIYYDSRLGNAIEHCYLLDLEQFLKAFPQHSRLPQLSILLCYVVKIDKRNHEPLYSLAFFPGQEMNSVSMPVRPQPMVAPSLCCN